MGPGLGPGPWARACTPPPVRPRRLQQERPRCEAKGKFQKIQSNNHFKDFVQFGPKG